MSAKCDGCWKLSSDTTGWIWFNFKYLKPCWLCPGCQADWKEHMEKLQRGGL